jgi:hypothetical protein
MTTLLAIVQDGVLAIGADGRASDGDHISTESAIKTARLNNMLCVGFAGDASLRVPIEAEVVGHPEWRYSDTVFERWEEANEVAPSSYQTMVGQVALMLSAIASSDPGKLDILLGGMRDGRWHLCEWRRENNGAFSSGELIDGAKDGPLGSCPIVKESRSGDLKRILEDIRCRPSSRLERAITYVAEHATLNSGAKILTVNGSALIRSSDDPERPFEKRWVNASSNTPALG